MAKKTKYRIRHLDGRRLIFRQERVEEVVVDLPSDSDFLLPKGGNGYDKVEENALIRQLAIEIFYRESLKESGKERGKPYVEGDPEEESALLKMKAFDEAFKNKDFALRRRIEDQIAETLVAVDFAPSGKDSSSSLKDEESMALASDEFQKLVGRGFYIERHEYLGEGEERERKTVSKRHYRVFLKSSSMSKKSSIFFVMDRGDGEEDFDAYSALMERVLLGYEADGKMKDGFVLSNFYAYTGLTLSGGVSYLEPEGESLLCQSKTVVVSPGSLVSRRIPVYTRLDEAGFKNLFRKALALASYGRLYKGLQEEAPKGDNWKHLDDSVWWSLAKENPEMAKNPPSEEDMGKMTKKSFSDVLAVLLSFAEEGEEGELGHKAGKKFRDYAKKVEVGKLDNDFLEAAENDLISLLAISPSEFHTKLKEKTILLSGQRKEIDDPFDGEGLLSPSLAEKIRESCRYGKRKGSSRTHHSFQIRLPYIKGMVHECDFLAFFHEHADLFEDFSYLGEGVFHSDLELRNAIREDRGEAKETHLVAHQAIRDREGLKILDYFGIYRLVDEIEMLLTPGQLKIKKLVEGFAGRKNDHQNIDAMEDYFTRARSLGYHLIISKVDSIKPSNIGSVRLNSQFLITSGNTWSKEKVQRMYEESEKRDRPWFLRIEDLAEQANAKRILSALSVLLGKAKESEKEKALEDLEKSLYFLQMQGYEENGRNEVSPSDLALLLKPLLAGERTGLEEDELKELGEGFFLLASSFEEGEDLEKASRSVELLKKEIQDLDLGPEETVEDISEEKESYEDEETEESEENDYSSDAEEVLEESKEDIERLVALRPEALWLELADRERNDSLLSYCDEFARGRFVVKGERRLLSSDLLYLLYSIIGEGKQLGEGEKAAAFALRANEFYAPVGDSEEEEGLFEYFPKKPCCLLRNPHLSKNENVLSYPYRRKGGSEETPDERVRYFGHLTGVCMINPTSLSHTRLGGADFDGDDVVIVDDIDFNEGIYPQFKRNGNGDFFLKNAELFIPYYPTIDIPAFKGSKKSKMEDLASSGVVSSCLRDTFGQKIGAYNYKGNGSSAVENAFPSMKRTRSSAPVDWVITVGLEIDKAKSGYNPKEPKGARGKKGSEEVEYGGFSYTRKYLLDFGVWLAKESGKKTKKRGKIRTIKLSDLDETLDKKEEASPESKKKLEAVGSLYPLHLFREFAAARQAEMKYRPGELRKTKLSEVLSENPAYVEETCRPYEDSKADLLKRLKDGAGEDSLLESLALEISTYKSVHSNWRSNKIGSGSDEAIKVSLGLMKGLEWHLPNDYLADFYYSHGDSPDLDPAILRDWGLESSEEHMEHLRHDGDDSSKGPYEELEEDYKSLLSSSLSQGYRLLPSLIHKYTENPHKYDQSEKFANFMEAYKGDHPKEELLEKKKELRDLEIRFVSSFLPLHYLLLLGGDPAKNSFCDGVTSLREYFKKKEKEKLEESYGHFLDCHNSILNTLKEKSEASALPSFISKDEFRLGADSIVSGFYEGKAMQEYLGDIFPYNKEIKRGLIYYFFPKIQEIRAFYNQKSNDDKTEVLKNRLSDAIGEEGYAYCLGLYLDGIIDDKELFDLFSDKIVGFLEKKEEEGETPS